MVALPDLHAAHGERPHRIGMLERTPEVGSAANIAGFRRGLRELGYLEGKDFVIEYRSADSRDERFPFLATELVRSKVEILAGRRLPAMYASAEFAGGLISCGVNSVEEPRTFELVIDSATARALGLTIPRALALRAEMRSGTPAVEPSAPSRARDGCQRSGRRGSARRTETSRRGRRSAWPRSGRRGPR
jgi:hypothetical protein